MKVAKWGNSLAVRLPSTVVEVLKLKENDDVEIHVEGTRALAVSKAADVREMLVRLRRFRGRMPADFKFDRLESNER